MTTRITLTAWRKWQAFRARLGEKSPRLRHEPSCSFCWQKPETIARDDMPEQWRARTNIDGQRVTVDLVVQCNGNLTFVRTYVEHDSPSALRRRARLAELNHKEQEKQA